MSEFAFGVGLNILGSLCINLGTNVVKYAHVESEAIEENNKRNKKILENGAYAPVANGEVHGGSSSSSNEEDDGFKPPVKEKLENISKTPKSFYLGWGLFIFGNGLNFTSFSFAPQSVLAALGSVQFVANVIFGAAVLKQPITKRIILATLAIVLGNVLLVVVSNKDTVEFDSQELLSAWKNIAWLVYLGFVIVGSVVLEIYYNHLLQLTNPVHRLMLAHLASMSEDEMSHHISVAPLPGRFSMSYRSRGDTSGDDEDDLDDLDDLAMSETPTPKAYSNLIPFCYAAVSGMIGSQSVMLAKSASILFRATITGDNQFTFFYTYIVFFLWGITIVFWLYRMNNALKMFDGMFIIPALQVIWIFFSVLGGGLYFEEFNNLDIWKYLVFVLGILIIFAGVYGLAPDTPTETQIARANSLPRSSISRTQVFNLNDDDAFRSSMSHISRTSSYSAFLSQPVLSPPVLAKSPSFEPRFSKNGSSYVSRTSHLSSRISDAHVRNPATIPVFSDANDLSMTPRQSVGYRQPLAGADRANSLPNNDSRDSFSIRAASPSPPPMGFDPRSQTSSDTSPVARASSFSVDTSRKQGLPYVQQLNTHQSLPTGGNKRTIFNLANLVSRAEQESKKSSGKKSEDSERSMFGKSSSYATENSTMASPIMSPTSSEVDSGMFGGVLYRARQSFAGMWLTGASSVSAIRGESEGRTDRAMSELDMLVQKNDPEAESQLSRSV